ncbi:MAG: hypothetical protein DYH16_07700 [Nitrosomonas sp. PRO5]|nr:hypothetical protein [Nitrosomonas sp. PRO5]
MHVFYFLLKFKKQDKLDYLENVKVAIWFESNIQTNNHDMEIVFMNLCAIFQGQAKSTRAGVVCRNCRHKKFSTM